jgi:hypothetical protein
MPVLMKHILQGDCFTGRTFRFSVYGVETLCRSFKDEYHISKANYNIIKNSIK